VLGRPLALIRGQIHFVLPTLRFRNPLGVDQQQNYDCEHRARTHADSLRIANGPTEKRV
jgi:hypothetical protein